MNIYDISKKSGVSTATVSRVINGSANVSEKTRSKVLAAIEESGYTPNVFARGLGLGTMKTIGILCADASDPYLARAVYFIERGLREKGYGSLLSCTGYAHDVKEKCMTMILSKKVDAVVLVGSNYVERDGELNEYIRNAARDVPVMIVNGALDAPNVYSVVCDDCAAIYELTRRFIASGRRQLLYLYNSDSYSGMKKLAGFRAAAKDAGISLEKERTHYLDLQCVTVDSVKKAVEEIARKGLVFDGVIASDDIIAVGALKYAKKSGIAVPDALFAAGYNNFDISECCEPELTSVDNKLETLCRHCVGELMGILSGDTNAPKRSVFSAEIIERETTKFIKMNEK